MLEDALFLAHLPDIMHKNEMKINRKFERTFPKKTIFDGFFKIIWRTRYKHMFSEIVMLIA